jgi:4-alpha-glucanotransferase
VATNDKQIRQTRSAGILLHPSCLPGPYGIGDFGEAAYAWVEALARARQAWWQVLPLGPTGYGDSPYQSFSAFAGNPNLIGPENLLKDGLISRSQIDNVLFSAQRVDFGAVIEFKRWLLQQAWHGFRTGRAPFLQPLFDAFCTQQAFWLDDFALFMALKDAQERKSWQDWPLDLVLRRPDAMAQARRELEEEANQHRFGQFLFFRQWNSLKNYANARGIHLIGDIPIFVSGDSADVWANPNLFLLDEYRRPRFVAGVPPDYFSATGQLWGNPLYNWPVLQESGFSWWIARIRATLAQVDHIRLDHFRGFEAFWQIPAGMPTAQVGQWVKAPGAELLKCLRKAIGGLPIIAEDLGLITPEVEALREQFGLPGMRILQFAFGGAAEDRFLPHNYEHHTVVYTGTHDNDTTRGWYATINDRERQHLREYLGKVDADDVAWDLIRLAWASVADMALAPLQDVLSLGTEARMNMPGRSGGFWSWRFTADMLDGRFLDRLAHLTQLYAREV